MNILALDSTAQVATVAVCDGEKRLAEYTVNNGNTHSETLLPMVESVLRVLGMTVDDIDLFAVSAGPGSFTGVRIGAATVKGLAFGRGKPCVGVSTLAALAEQVRGFDGLICPVMNARRNQVYTALFRSENGILTRLWEDMAISIDELDKRLAAYAEPVMLLGDGYAITVGQLRHEVRSLPLSLREQSAYAVAQAARAAYEAGDTQTDCELFPTYLRLSQAERERAERENMKSSENKPNEN